MNEKISVIVPVYNVEPYIKKCINSIIKQTYKNIEIIIVDDGSPDQCGKIADSYALKDHRVRVIHKENGGLASAYNSGLSVATGEYIGFVDSDDWIEPSMYESMLNMMKLQDCDLVECGLNAVYGRKIYKFNNNENYVLSGRDALIKHLTRNGSNDMPIIAAWSKLFKASFWADKRFPNVKHLEHMITCEALYNANRVGFVNKGMYNHLFTNAGSITNSKFGTADLVIEQQYYNRVIFAQEKGDLEIAKLAEESYFVQLLILYYRCVLAKMEQKNHYLDIIKKRRNDILNSGIKKRKKLEFRILYVSPQIYMIYRTTLSWITGTINRIKKFFI